jgi:hypothetical protein
MNSIMKAITSGSGRVPHSASPSAGGMGGAVRGPASPGAKPTSNVQDMLSRPKRTRRTGYQKTAERPGQSRPTPTTAKMPALGAMAALSGAGAPLPSPMGAPAGAAPGLPPM